MCISGNAIHTGHLGSFGWLKSTKRPPNVSFYQVGWGKVDKPLEPSPEPRKCSRIPLNGSNGAQGFTFEE